MQSVSRVLRFQRKTPSVQTSFTQGNEDAKHCHIQPPLKDQHNMCLGHKYGTVSEQDFREHEKRKEESKQKKKNDKQEAEGNENIRVLTMDLQVVLLTPRVFVNANYYKT